MKLSNFWIASLIIYIVSMVLGYSIHECLLKADYMMIAHLLRTPEEAKAFFPWMLVGNVFYSLAFVWIYRRGKENKPCLGQGVRYGLAMAALYVIPMYLIYYSVQPMPEMLVFKQIAFETVGVLILGVLVACLHNRQSMF